MPGRIDQALEEASHALKEQSYVPSNTTAGKKPTAAPKASYIVSIAPASAVGTGNPGMSALLDMRALSAAYAATMRWLPQHRVTESSRSALSTNCACPTAPLEVAKVANSWRSWLVG